MERRQRRGASGAPIVEKRTERGQGALLGLDRTSFGSLKIVGVVTAVSDHDRSLPSSNNQFSARFITDPRDTRPEIAFIGPKVAEQEPTQLISLPASAALPMVGIFAREAGGEVATYRGASSAAWRSASMRLRSSATPLPAMSKAVP